MVATVSAAAVPLPHLPPLSGEIRARRCTDAARFCMAAGPRGGGEPRQR